GAIAAGGNAVGEDAVGDAVGEDAVGDAVEDAVGGAVGDNAVGDNAVAGGADAGGADTGADGAGGDGAGGDNGEDASEAAEYKETGGRYAGILTSSKIRGTSRKRYRLPETRLRYTGRERSTTTILN
ncbi:MAG: hypothetical protein Q9226_005425, partial [Calogaya cf. arnoldii]